MNKRLPIIAILIFLGISFLISGCGPEQLLEPTSTLTPTTSNPTATIMPTETPQPTPTFTVTPTIEPPSELITLFEEVRFYYYESFDSLPVKQWDDVKGCLDFKNSVLETKCMDYNGEISLHRGEGMLVDFYHDDADEFYADISLVSGMPGPRSDDFKMIGLTSMNGYGGGYGQVIKYSDLISNFSSDSWERNLINPDIWYRLVLAIGEDGSTIVSLWERDTPNAQMETYKQTKIEGWADSEWRLWVASEGVSVVLDNYYQFDFSNIK